MCEGVNSSGGPLVYEEGTQPVPGRRSCIWTSRGITASLEEFFFLAAVSLVDTFGLRLINQAAIGECGELLYL